MKIIRTNTQLLLRFAALAILAAVSGCGHLKNHEAPPEPDQAVTLQLIEWLEKNGNYINSEKIPSIADAATVFAMRSENILVLDLRTQAEFDSGHIANAINIRATELIDFLDHKVNAPAFRYIFLTCNNGNQSGYAAGVLRLLGYDNVYAIRFGMSGWSRKVAEKHWLGAISSHLAGKLETVSHPKAAPGGLPIVRANAVTGYGIARERARQLLAEAEKAFSITLEEYTKNPGLYYNICYWPEDKYISNGHLPGAIAYEPKTSLVRNAYLNTLPSGQPVIVYCYSGQHSVFVAAYLRMIGYDARSLVYGANAFFHSVMAQTEPRPTRTFTEALIQNLPVVVSGKKTAEKQAAGIKIEKVTVEGGCL